jgi:beta-lactamase class A
MAIFSKKKEEDYEDSTSPDKNRGPRGKRGKINTTRTGKKKEPPKPWGKKERLLVFFFFAVTVLASSVLALSARSWKLPGLPRIKISLPSFSFFREETIVIEGDKGGLRDREKSEEIVADFKEKTENLSGVYGLYVTDLESGFSYGVNEFDTYEPASLNKLPVMAAMFIEAEEGSLDLESKYKLKNSDKATGAGSLFTRPEGYEITYRNLIRLMGKQSDNTAFNVARNLLGDEKINQAIIKIGMKNTSLQENETTPVDIGIFFEELWHGNIVSNKHRDELLDYLTGTIYEAWITEGVPGEVRVAHKYGRETHVVNDAGIIYAQDPFVVVIMSKGVIEREADLALPDLARIVYEAETR